MTSTREADTNTVPAAAVHALAAAVATLGHQLGLHGGTAAQLTRMGARPDDAQATADWLNKPPPP